jgi:NAD(P)H-hydrate epimerase
LTQEKEAVEFVQALFRSQERAKRRGRIGFQVGGKGDDDDSAEVPTFPPLVVDADGLNALALLEDEEWWLRLPTGSVLTPHPGEMARLMGVEAGDVQADRIGVAGASAEKWGHVVLLKGAHTVIANPDGRRVLLPFSTPALATAGSGDVLAGAIAGFLAQGVDPFDAALVGGYIHGLAGRWVGDEVGSAGAVASDLLPRLPRAITGLRQVE